MIPEHRLAVLLDDVKDSWIQKCLFHNKLVSPSLYMDHHCEREDFPTKPVLDLRHHKDEVWFLQYSNDGTKLASTSKDTSIIIYETTSYSVLHQFEEHSGSGVTYLSWSPDDTKIITCSSQPENAARIWDVKVRRYHHINCQMHANFIRLGHAYSASATSHIHARQRLGLPAGNLLLSDHRTKNMVAGFGIWMAILFTISVKKGLASVPMTWPSPLSAIVLSLSQRRRLPSGTSQATKRLASGN